jgi:hypothetical protein
MPFLKLRWQWKLGMMNKFQSPTGRPQNDIGRPAEILLAVGKYITHCFIGLKWQQIAS